jgi:DNA-binding MarR family transcriptional regulator
VANADLQVRDYLPHGGAPVKREAAATPAAMPSRLRVDLSRPQDIVHCLLFIIEYSNSADRKWQEHKRHLSLFLSRAGGLHLLLMLLNAFYNKPAAGRRPGWTFTSLRDRIQISERGLRMLINDAVAEGLIEQLPVTGSHDRRCRSYRLATPVVEAWEVLMRALHRSIAGVLDDFDAGSLANADYRRWNPEVPARDQAEPLPPSRRLRQRPWPPRRP